MSPREKDRHFNCSIAAIAARDAPIKRPKGIPMPRPRSLAWQVYFTRARSLKLSTHESRSKIAPLTQADLDIWLGFTVLKKVWFLKFSMGIFINNVYFIFHYAAVTSTIAMCVLSKTCTCTGRQLHVSVINCCINSNFPRGISNFGSLARQTQYAC